MNNEGVIIIIEEDTMDSGGINVQLVLVCGWITGSERCWYGTDLSSCKRGTAHVLSVHNMVNRNTGKKMNVNETKRLSELGITIMLENGDINRFPTVSDYSSYCRCVSSKKVSNGKKKGEGNKKNGNKYLSILSNRAGADL